MRDWRAKCGVACLALGYLLFFGVMIAENVYTVEFMARTRDPGLAAEAFRAGWLPWVARLAPLRAFIEGPCARLPWMSLSLFVPAALLLAGGYLAVLRAVRREPGGWTLARLLGLGALAAVPLLLLVPPTSGDYVAYLLAGRVLSVYHLSPWHHPLAQFPAEQIYVAPSAWGADLKCAYGPAWVAVMGAITGVCHLIASGPITLGSLLLNLLALRLANVAALGLAAAAIWQIQGLLWPRQQRLVTAAFLLNPLVVYESLGALHNDLWGVALLLWAAYLFLRDDRRFVLPLALSILTKYIVFALVPLFAVYYVRRRDWGRLASVAGTALLCLGLTHLTDPTYLTSRLAASAGEFIASPTSLPQSLLSGVYLIYRLPDLAGAILAAARVLTFLFLPVYGALVWRTRTRSQVLGHGTLVLVLYLTGVYMQTMQWYYLWPLGLLCATHWGRASVNVAWASTCVLLGYVMYFGNHNAWSAPGQVISFLLALGLPAAVWLLGRRGWWTACAPADDTEPVDGSPRDGRGRPSEGDRNRGARRATVAPAVLVGQRPGGRSTR